MSQARTFACITASTLLFLMAARSAGEGQGTRHAWTMPGELRMAIVGDPRTLNPLLATTADEDDLAALDSDLLLGTDAHGEPFPELASRVPSTANGDISADGKTIVFRLRHNVKWQDGAPFTSADVRFSWRAVMNPQNNVASRAGYDLITTVDTPDTYTAVFRLQKPYGAALATFFCSGQTARILPEHLLGKYPNLNTVPFNEKPVGTGPFKVVSWKRGQSIEFEANDDYFFGKPKLRHISVRIVPSTTTLGIELKTHELDLAYLDSATYRDMRGAPEVRLELAPQYVFISLGYNLARPAFADLRVRRAVAFSIDRNALVEKLTFGTAELATGDIAPLSWAYAKDVTTYPYDPAKARGLLDAAGWKPGPDGIRVKNEKRLTADMAEAAGGTTGHNLDVEIQSMLKAVGIDAVIRTYAPALMYAPKADGGIFASGKFDVSLFSWSQSADPDNTTLFGCAYVAPKGQNFSNYCNPAVDRLQAQALASYDQAVRKPLYLRIEKILSDDLPHYPLYFPKRRIGMNPDLTGLTFNGVTITANAYQWSL